MKLYVGTKVIYTYQYENFASLIRGKIYTVDTVTKQRTPNETVFVTLKELDGEKKWEERIQFQTSDFDIVSDTTLRLERIENKLDKLLKEIK